ncbi:hypothetical protein NITLEN_10960 [Nitrospira lenta]|uniref:Uncharacterized protein n=1 Tax=Nitrospira lenta TaxID=1436998 RepID=A0A330L2K5_9BACT|nr:hypothetical protein NITLEN_10960 [Nitrospira lenta]
MGGDQNRFALQYVWLDLALIVGEHPLRRILQAFSPGRAHIKAPAPDLDLVVTELLGRFGFVQPLQLPIHPLIQRLVLLDRNICLSASLKRQAQSFIGPGQHRAKCSVEGKAAQFIAGILGFLDAARGQRDIDPTGEPIFQIPLRFTVTQQDQASHSHLLCSGSQVSVSKNTGSAGQVKPLLSSGTSSTMPLYSLHSGTDDP